VEFPSEVAKRITFEEQVTDISINRLSCPNIDERHLVSKGHTTLNVGQVIHWIRLDRHIMQILTFVGIMTIQ
jgi:hypothetical protein